MSAFRARGKLIPGPIPRTRNFSKFFKSQKTWARSAHFQKSQIPVFQNTRNQLSNKFNSLRHFSASWHEADPSLQFKGVKGLGKQKGGSDMSISRCRRCGEFSYEQLSTHGYCVSCNYSKDLIENDDTAADFAAVCRIVDKEEIQSSVIKRATQRFLKAADERKEMESEVC
jgi:ribosomal protein L37E